MKLNRKKVSVIVALAVFALVGLVAVQFLLLRDAYALKEQAFERNALTALGILNKKIEMRTTFDVLLSPTIAIKERKAKSGTELIRGKKIEEPSIGIWLQDTAMDFALIPNYESRPMKTPRPFKIEVFDSFNRLDTVVVLPLNVSYCVDLNIPRNIWRKGNTWFRISTDSAVTSFRYTGGLRRVIYLGKVAEYARKQIMTSLIDQLYAPQTVPIEQRVTKENLDTLIALSLQEVGITIPFDFALSTATNKLIYSRPSHSPDKLRASKLRTSLSPDYSLESYRLSIYFPTREMYLFSQLGWILIITLLFFVIIFSTFLATISMLVKQNRFALRLRQFINNMTHEFKTPLSTIALAGQALEKPEVANAPEKFERHTRIIQDETSRMKRQVEKILEMAALEQGDLSIEAVPIDVHDILHRLTPRMMVQIEERNGSLSTNFQATGSIIAGDAMYVEGIFYNLLDNAVKYSSTAPHIVLSSKNQEGLLVVEVQDNGIGIPPEHQRRVFENYYRVPTGNLHDVKGFGMGLSYVKLMMKAHKGEVILRSEPGKGTFVRLQFPLLNSGTPDNRGKQ